MKEKITANKIKRRALAYLIILLSVFTGCSTAHTGDKSTDKPSVPLETKPVSTVIYYNESQNSAGNIIPEGQRKSMDGDFGAVFIDGQFVEGNWTVSSGGFKVGYTYLSSGNRTAQRAIYTVLNSNNYTSDVILKGVMQACEKNYKDQYAAGLISNKNIAVTDKTGKDIPGIEMVFKCKVSGQDYYSNLRIYCITNGSSEFKIYTFIYNTPAEFKDAPGVQVFFDSCFFGGVAAKTNANSAETAAPGSQATPEPDTITVADIVTFSYYDIGSTYLTDSEGNLWVWGGNQYGQLGDGTMSDVLTPKKIMDNVSRVAAGYGYAFAVKKDGSLWGWGTNDKGQMYNATKTANLVPKKLMDGVKDAYTANTYNYVIKDDGSLWGWGEYSLDLKKHMDGAVKNVYATSDYMMVLKDDGSFWTQGADFNNILGNGPSYHSGYEPKKVLSDVKDFYAGFDFVLAVKNDGSLWGWGSNSKGQLGDGGTQEIDSPKKLMDGVAEMYAGDGYSVVLKEDGSVWSWGSNNACQLGNGTRTDSLVPVKVLDEVQHIFCGYWHTFALKDDGSLWGWGDGAYSQLGNDQYEAVPAPIKILDDVKTVTAGRGYTYAVKTDGSFWVWGSDYHGTLGDGPDSGSTIPKEIFIIKQ